MSCLYARPEACLHPRSGLCTVTRSLCCPHLRNSDPKNAVVAHPDLTHAFKSGLDIVAIGKGWDAEGEGVSDTLVGFLASLLIVGTPWAPLGLDTSGGLGRLPVTFLPMSVIALLTPPG